MPRPRKGVRQFSPGERCIVLPEPKKKRTGQQPQDPPQPAKKGREEKECPKCHLILPVTGICDNC